MSQPSPVLQVTAEGLRRHADHLEATAGAATNVPAEPGPDAYGRLCVFVPALLAQLRTPLAEAVTVAARSVRGSADAVRRAADLYEHVDAEAGESLQGGP